MDEQGAELAGAVRRALDGAGVEGLAVVAVSGGPDSVALLYLVAAARPDLRLVAGHVRHGLRDDAVDAQVAAGHAGALGAAYEERAVDVRPTRREGLEAAARAARYAALGEIAAAAGARWVLVGHTADDQAETVLLNLARGTGLRGLAGMAPSNQIPHWGDPVPLGTEYPGRGICHPPCPPGWPRIVRPLLTLRRADVRRYAAARRLATVDDPTNADPARRRAVVRRAVLPALGDPVEAIARVARLARQDADLLDALAGEQAAAVVRAWGPARMVRREALAGLPPALATRVVRLLLAEVRAGAGGATRRRHAAGGDLLLGSAPDAATTERVLALTGMTDVGGDVRASGGGGWLAAAPVRPRTGVRVVTGSGPAAREGVLAPPWGGPGAAALPQGAPLTVRRWRPGDRLPAGRTVADALARAGVPRVVRPLVPVVCAGDAPLWAPGLPAPGGPRHAWLVG